MAWALQFDGVNDRAPLSSPIFNPIPVGGSLEYIGIRGFGSGSLQMFINVYQGARTDIIALNNAGVLRVRIDGTIKDSPDAVTQGDQFTLLITRTASLYAISLNGVHQFDIVKTADMSELIGFCQDNFQYEGSLLTSTINDGTIDTALWDATASSHAAGTPVLTDTIGGNNATGVNMPTDGSAWVNLGGSGISGTITQTAQSFTQSLSGSVINSYTGTITQNTQSFTQSASGSITSEPITGVINQTVTAFTQSALGDVVSSGISGAINQTTSAFTQSATGSAVLNISGVISQTVSAFTQSLSGTVAEQISGTINQTVSSFTMSAVGRVPASWTDKLPANTTWADQTAISTIWTDK